MTNSSRFIFTLIGSQESFRVTEFHGQEDLSSPFEWQITLACENANLDLAQLIDHSALLTLKGEETQASQRLVHGHVSQAEYLKTSTRFSVYRLTLTPQLYYFGLRSGHRIFQDLSVPDIIRQLFTDAKIPADQIQWKLKRSYSSRPYCVQYGETELAFISRLLAEEGIHYHFHHHRDRHVMVFSDHNNVFAANQNTPTLPFIQEQSRAHGNTSVYQFELNHQTSASQTTLIDFYFTSPKKPLLHSAGNGTKQITTYPGKYQSTSSGKRYTTNRLEQQQCMQDVASAKTNALLMTGSRFSLTNASNTTWNQDFLIVKMTHQGQQPQSLDEYASIQPCTYNNQLTCIPSNVPFRPVIDHCHKPLARGTTPAIVTGPAGEEIYTDQHGRVKVQFPWDRASTANENSSCWLRVKQSWTGIEYGSTTLPRVGQEVIISYENSDPDRPLVTGRLYNGNNKTPYVLPANKSRTALKTHTSPKGDGYNELRIEDKKHQEQLFVHAQKDIDIHVKQDKKTFIQRNQHDTINGSCYQQTNTLNQTIDGQYNEKIGKQLSLSINKDINIKISGTQAIQAGNAVYIKSGMKAVLDAGQQLTLKAGAGTICLDPSGVSITGPMVLINEGGGGGAALPPMPIPPAAPVEADKNKAGQNFKSSPTQAPPSVSSEASTQAAAQAINLRMAAKTNAPLVRIPPNN